MPGAVGNGVLYDHGSRAMGAAQSRDREADHVEHQKLQKVGPLIQAVAHCDEIYGKRSDRVYYETVVALVELATSRSIR
jgi:hypothetical protein